MVPLVVLISTSEMKCCRVSCVLLLNVVEFHMSWYFWKIIIFLDQLIH